MSGTSALITDDDKGRAWSLEIQRALGAPELFVPVAVRQMVCSPLSQSIWPHHFNQARLFSYPRLTGLYHAASMSTRKWSATLTEKELSFIPRCPAPFD